MNIQKLAKKWGSDKAIHPSYCAKYDQIFEPIREEELVVLEIGVHQGSSLLMWGEYFPNSKIYGLDDFHRGSTTINTGHNPKACSYDRVVDRVSSNANITVIQGCQSELSTLRTVVEKIGEDIDIIIDDGAHWPDFIDISLGQLFSKLKPGGYYIIEDVQTSEYRQSKKLHLKSETHVFEDRLIKKLKHMDSGNQYPSNSMLSSQSKYISENISNWEFTNCSGTCVLTKKKKGQ